MKKLKFTVIILSALITLYLGFIFAVSLFLNSDNFIRISDNFIKTGYNMNIDINDLKIKISPLLSVKMTAKSINIKDNDKVGLSIQNLDTSINKGKFQNIDADLIYANLDILKKLKNEKVKDTKKKKSFDINKIPDANIKKIEIIRNEGEKLSITSNQFVIKENNGIKNLDIILNITLDRVLYPILAGEVGSLYIENKKLKAKNFPIAVGKTRVFVDGSILNDKKLDNFTIKGDKIPVKETMATVLFLQKYGADERKFIENFTDFKGTADVDLVYKDNDLSGVITGNDLFAKFLPFYVPVYCKKAEFFIKNGEVKSYAVGTFGTEKLTHELLIKEMYNREKKEVFGKVNSKITTALAKKYLPSNIKVKNYLDMEVDYYIKQKKPDAKYYINIPADSGIMFNDFYAGIRNKNKKIFAETQKIDKEFFLKDYRFSVQENNEFKDILYGNGYFKIINGKMTPQYITLNTNGYVPNSFVGSFKQYVLGGKFSGALKYNYTTEQITGKFEVIDTIFNYFHVKSASVIADDKTAKIEAYGTYKNEKFNCKTEVKNDFKDKIYVNYMDLFLDKFIVRKSDKSAKQNKKFDFNSPNKKLSSGVRDINMDIDKYNIAVNSIIVKDYPVNNIKVFGSLKDAIFKYNTSEIGFADGKLSANGIYDFNIDSSVVDFTAKNIDSNIIADKFFNIKNQIQGKADLEIHSKTDKNWENWDAYAKFDIKNGALPGLENLEFTIDKNSNKKVKVSDYVKFNAKKKGNIKSHISGFFKCDDVFIRDIDIRMQHEFISAYIEGFYDYIIEQGNLDIWGKYDNSAVKQIKVLHIPLNWLVNVLVPSEKKKAETQIDFDKIPSIGVDDSKAKYFRINIKVNEKDSTKTDITTKLIK
ncbi:hypothetical protein J6P92_09120 [bacterium]|nr:hypothetical protein [bacterium]